MKAIQILMEEQVLTALDEEAARDGSDRSKLIRGAVVDFLAARRRREQEEAHRRGYERFPQTTEELADWEAIQVWPED